MLIMLKREAKYPETYSFIYHNQNPRNRITGDCCFRAISLGLNQDYNTTVLEMAQTMCRTGYALNDTKGESEYLKEKKWVKHNQLKHEDGTKYTGKQFANWLSINYPNGEIGNVICHIGGHHIVCFKPTYHGEGFNCKYKCHDIWDSTEGCVGIWWTKN
jgi:hypothetical protein